MDLYKEILAQILAKGEVSISFPNLHVDVTQIVENECYAALERIKTIIHDDSLSDKDCFMKIEEIICALEDAGSSGGGRHDF